MFSIAYFLFFFQFEYQYEPLRNQLLLFDELEAGEGKLRYYQLRHDSGAVIRWCVAVCNVVVDNDELSALFQTLLDARDEIVLNELDVGDVYRVVH